MAKSKKNKHLYSLTAKQKLHIDILKKQHGGEGRPGSVKYNHLKSLRSLKQQLIEMVEGKCEICAGDIHLVLHHRHYKTWGREELNDVILLDGKCHTLIHEKQPGLI